MTIHKLSTVLIVCLLPGTGSFGQAWQTPKSGRMDPTKYTIYITNLGNASDRAHSLLQLHNNSIVRIRVPARYARSEHTIYVPFNYEWELDGSGPRSGVGEPEHYVISVIGPTI